MKGDHYKVLEVRRDASPEEIQRAYRSLALRFHPDRNSAADAASRMTAINEAWEILGDPVRRSEYDAVLSRPVLAPEFMASILLAARELLLRAGWRVVDENVKTLVLEKLRQRVRVVFLERADNGVLEGVSRFPEFCVVLAVKVEGPIFSAATVIDLLNSESYGAKLPDDPMASCRSLFAAFL